MRKGWEYKKLGEVCDVINGYAFKSSKYTSQGTRIIRITNVQKGYVVDNDPKFYSDEDFKDLFQYSLFEGDLVMSLTGNVGRVGILQKNMIPAALNQRVACLRVKSEKMRLNYLFHLLNSNLFEIAAIQSARGIAQLNMSTEWLKNYIIPLPPPSTQLAIVSELDKINELIRLKKEQLKDFDNLAQSLFYEMFGDPVENEKGWEVKKLKEIATEKLSYGSGASAVPFNTSVRYIRITDINEYGELKEEKVSPNIFEEKYLLAEGDILFARSGATVGKTYLHKRNENPCIYAGYLIRLRPNEKLVLPNYVYYYTKSNYYKSFICANQRVVAQPNINAKQYGDLELPLPPLSLQHLFAQRIEQIEREKSEVQKSIQNLETLLASRMQYWFE